MILHYKTCYVNKHYNGPIAIDAKMSNKNDTNN